VVVHSLALNARFVSEIITSHKLITLETRYNVLQHNVN